MVYFFDICQSVFKDPRHRHPEMLQQVINLRILTHEPTHLDMHAHMHARAHARTYTCTHARRTHARTHAHTHACTHARMHARTEHTLTRRHTHTLYRYGEPNG